MIKIKVGLKENQLNNLYDYKEYIISNDIVLFDFLQKNAYKKGTISVNVNGLFFSEKEIKEYVLKNEDIVLIEQLACEPISSIFVAIGAYLKAHAFIAFLAKTAALIAVNLLIGALAKKKSNASFAAAAAGKEQKNVQNYGISGGQNEVKAYSGLKLGIGSIRIFPDISQQGFNDYKINNNNPHFYSTEIPFFQKIDVPKNLNIANALHFERILIFAENGNGVTSNFTTDYYYFGPPRTYNVPLEYGQFTTPYTWVIVVSGNDFDNAVVSTYEWASYFAKNDWSIYPSWLKSNQRTSELAFEYTKPKPLSEVNSAAGATINVVQFWGHYGIKKLQRLVQGFNFGLGDIDISDFRLGKTNIDSFKNKKIYSYVKNNFDENSSAGYFFGPNSQGIVPADINVNNSIQAILSEFPSYTFNGAGVNTNKNNANSIISYQDFKLNPELNLNVNNENFIHIKKNDIGIDAYPTCVEVIAGGGLSTNVSYDGINNDPLLKGFVIKKGGKNCYAVEINFSGRLMYLNAATGKIEAARIEVEIFYRQDGAGGASLLPPSAPWQKLADIEMKNASTNAYNNTYYKILPNIYNSIEIAVRKKTLDFNDPNLTDEIEVTTINFFNEQTIYYAAQNRVMLEILADAQINGQADKFSALCNYKTWVVVDVGGTNEFLPSVYGKNWSWVHTRNPAWWFLYFAMGGYLNQQNNNNHPLSNTGWMLGEHAANGIRIFGCGEKIKMIDLERIYEWSVYCKNLNLNIDMEIASDEDSYTVLSKIAAIGRARVFRRSNGKLSVFFHKKNDIIKQEFGSANIKFNTLKTIFKNKRNADEYIVTYADRTDDFKIKTWREKVPLVQTPTNFENLDLVGITDENQAKRECRLAAANDFFNKEIKEFVCGKAYFALECGDIIRLADLNESGRIISFLIVNALVDEIEISIDTAFEIGANYFISVRSPEGDLMQHSCKVSGKNKIKITSQWQASNAAYFLNAKNQENILSVYQNSIPEDFTFLGSTNDKIAGKYRVIQIEPMGNEAKITCMPEILEYYASENDLLNLNYTNEIINDNFAIIENMHAVKNSAGGYRLHWDNINCSGADLSVTTINSAGIISVDSDSLFLDYQKGTELKIIAVPKNIGGHKWQESSTFNLILD
jgi:cupin superfamily acireductone dioxygenase involved in methionine salvage